MKKLLTLAIILLPWVASAQKDSLQHELSLGVNILAHGEICGGGLPRASHSTENRSAFLLGRTRLVLDFKQEKWLQTHLVIQNTAIWGMKGNQAINLYEGWARLQAPFGLFAQFGRIALSYDDERIIGTNDFANASKSHDALRLGYEGYGHQLHAILAYNQNGENVYSGTYYAGGAQPYKSMQTAWYHYEVPVFPLGVSLLFMNLGLQAGIEGDDDNPPHVENQQMYGGYLKFHPQWMTVEGSYYRQGGKQVSDYMSGVPIKAWMASAKLTVKPSERYGFVGGYDYLSGDDYVPVIYGGTLGLPRHEVLGGFSPVNGSRTKFYGLLDFFYQSASINGFTPGLQNAYAGAFGKPWKGLSCSLTYHYLAVATQLKDLGETLGHSVDIGLSYAFSKDIVLAFGYTQMIGTDTMALLKQEGKGKRANWGWFSLVVSPTVFSRRW